MSRPRLFFWGLLVVAILWGMGLTWKPVEIQDDLLQRSTKSLAMNGIHDVDLSFDGRDAYVDPDTPNFEEVRSIVESVYGVRVVSSGRIDRVDDGGPQLDDPSFTLEIEEGLAVASGNLGQEFSATDLESILKTRFGDENVRLEMNSDVAVKNYPSLDNFMTIVDNITDHVLQPSILLNKTAGGNMLLSVSGDLRDLSNKNSLLASLQSLTDSTLTIESDFESGLAQRGLNALILGENVAFLPGRAELRSSSRSLLNAIADSLKLYESVNISVEGHTDAFGDADSNLLLSLNRANTVVDYLIGRGIDRGRLEPQGFGETIPVASNDNAQGRRKNRRVEFNVR